MNAGSKRLAKESYRSFLKAVKEGGKLPEKRPYWPKQRQRGEQTGQRPGHWKQKELGWLCQMWFRDA